MITVENEIKMFENITKEMNSVFAKKRKDYGQTTSEAFEKFGPLSMYIRMFDKMGRLENLMVKENENRVGEKIEDTLLDLANYAVITLIELQKQKDKRSTNYDSERKMDG